MLQSLVVALLLLHGAICQFTTTPMFTETVVEGQDLTLECVYTNALNIDWLREGQSVVFPDSGFTVGTTVNGSSTLTISSANRTIHNASFSCQATTPLNTTDAFDFEILVYYIDSEVGVTQAEDVCSGTAVYVGSTVTLTCDPPAAFPAPSYSWLRNGNSVTQGNNIELVGPQLTISGIMSNQGGDWSCRVENAANIPRTSAALHISVTSTAMRTAMIEASSPLLVERGAAAMFSCVFNPPLFGADRSRVFWSVDSAGAGAATILQCSYLLTVENFSPSDEGTYRCYYSDNNNRIDSQPVQVVIATLRQSYSLSMSPLSPIGAGMGVVFTCTPEGMAGNVDEVLNWRFLSSITNTGGVVVSGDHLSIDTNGQRLSVSQLTVNDSGLYSCVASHPLVAEVVNSIPLTVEATPSVVVTPSTVTVTLGTPVTLTCSINSSRSSTFQWTIGGQTLTQSIGRMKITNTASQSILTLATAEVSDLGEVLCVATDPIHLAVSQTSTLVESSEFYIYGNSSARNVTLLDSTRFRLECVVRGASSEVTVEWFRNRQDVTREAGYTILPTLDNGTSILIGGNVTLNSGNDVYSCKATDSDISLSQKFDIFVMVPGSIVDQPPPLTNGSLGSVFQLVCVAEGNPKPQITWRYRGEPVNSFNSSFRVDNGDGVLVFNPLMVEHAGGYSCSIDIPTFLFKSTTLTVFDNGLNLTQNEIIIFIVIVVFAFFVLLFSAALGIYCSLRRYRLSDRTTGKYEVAKQTAFDRQSSLRTRPDNSGVLSASPSNDLMDALHKSQEGKYNYMDQGEYSINATTIQLDMYSGTAASSTGLSDKYPVSSQTSTPLHTTEASVSLFRSSDDQLPNFPRTNLEFGDVMGEGEFGPVVMGVANYILPNQEKTLVAVKVLVPPDQDDGGVRPEDAIVDFANQMKLAYTNVASILGICSDTQPFYVIYEYLDQGDLKKFLRQSEPEEGDPPTLTRANMRKIILQVADGMAYLFSQRIIHGDLATRNCLVSSTLEVKIADLGIGHDLYGKDYYDNGTSLLPIRWMPPELLSQLQAGPSFSLYSDIWSFGVFCWEVFAYSKLPYGNFEDSEILSMVPNGSRLRPPSTTCPHLLYDLMTECWHEVPDKRPQFARLCVAIVDMDVGQD